NVSDSEKLSDWSRAGSSSRQARHPSHARVRPCDTVQWTRNGMARVSMLRQGQWAERAAKGHTAAARCYALVSSSPSYPGQLTHKALPPRTVRDIPSVPLDTVPLDNGGLNSILDCY